ncbi:RagB/SusD family nutrient uptake outer membrane protein [Olivibacter sitiensis]|uniref:RagB/SusD family nutrient uptake outer membrane protein n=1 Tax=Olivibacter sitiensis TaxID=376470 RepID=UPI00041E2C58|nr:RagB/SusD family nutrient uptake outer membrane protein [Olivibacter sitiensis]
MKKKDIYLYCTLTLLFTGTACNKFLDLNPISVATSSNAYVSAGDAEAALTGVYNSFTAMEYYVWDNINFSDVMSDNYYAGGDDAEIYAIDNLELTPVNSRIYQNWGEMYDAIKKANVVIQQTPEIADPKLDIDNRRNQIIGEASFLRALHYYQLVKAFGGVPIVTEPVSSLDPGETQIPKSTEEEVYEQIVSDLTVAMENLPDSYGNAANVNKARATKGAANALMAKVSAQRPNRDYNKVLEHANAVISSPANYSLIPFPDLFDGAHYNNAESIMEVQYLGGNYANWGPQMLLPPSISGDSWRKFVTPSKDLVKAFDDEGDEIRKNASILFENVEWTDEFWSINTGGSVPFAYKWKSANGWASTNRQYILRLGDIVLLKAEALNELDRPAEALEALNEIRQRVSLDPVTTTDKAALRLAIEKERRLELCQEAQRWDDLKRYGRALAVMNGLNEIDLRTNRRKEYNMQEYKLLLPFPQNELNRNPNLVQNPGY